jgi:hypothetical protein
MGPLAAVEQSFEGRSLAFVDYDHPVFQPFAASRSGDFSSVRLYRYRAVPDAATSGAGAAVSDQVGGGRVLARFDDGRAALAEHELGSGRVVAWGSSLDAEWGDLVVAPVFVPWIDRVVRYLADFEPPQVAYSVGEVARLEMRAGVDELAVLHPNGESERVGAERELLLALTQTGFYEVRPVAAADGEERVVAVNPQAAESDLTRLDPEELLVALTPSETAVARTGDGTSASTGGHEQRWWWYVMMAALAILIVEGWMANRKGRSLQASDATPELISASVS